MKYILKFLFGLLMLMHGFHSSFAQASIKMLKAPCRLRTDLLLHRSEVPEIRNLQPGFSWEVDTSIKKIAACRLMLATDAALLRAGKADIWDTQKKNHGSGLLRYEGKPLEAGRTYYWKVQIWNEHGMGSAFSDIVSFKMSKDVSKDAANTMFSFYPQDADIQQPAQILEKQSGQYFFDFGKDGFAQLLLHVNSTKEDTLVIEAGEMMGADHTVAPSPNKSIRYIKLRLAIHPGERDYPLVWPGDAKRDNRNNPVKMPESIGEVFPFRYVSIDHLPGKIGKADIKRRMIHYPFDEGASSFQSSDTTLNQVWDLCKYTVKATSFGGMYVDGDRERLPYEADALINQLSHYATDAEYSMARRSMAYLLYHPTWPTEWSLQNVLMAWNDYMYTGDDTYLKKYYTELQQKVLLPLADSTGLISTRTGRQSAAFLASLHKDDFDGRHGLVDIVDWPQSGVVDAEKEYGGETDGYVMTTYNAVVNAFYYRNLVLMQQIASILHKNADAKVYAEKARQVYQSYGRIFCSPSNGLIKDGDQTNHASLHGNMFALVFGLVPDKDLPSVIDFIQSRKMACSVYGSQFLLDGLYEYGAGHYGLQLMNAKGLRSWYNMIRVGSTITMEAWDRKYKPNLDLNHAWGAAPANIIIRRLMGVTPLTPGFEKIAIRPMPGNLLWADMKTTTIKGTISVSFRKNQAEESWNLLLPGATSTELTLPNDSNKKTLYLDGQLSGQTAKNGYWVLTGLKSGLHHILLK